MVLNIPNFIIKGVVFGWMGYLTYTYVCIYRLENQTKKLEAWKQNQIAKGEKVEVPTELKEAQFYQDNHYGKRLLERIKTQHVLEEQVKYSLQAKRDLRNKLIKESNEEEVNKIEEEIKQLDDLFSKIKSRETKN